MTDFILQRQSSVTIIIETISPTKPKYLVFVPLQKTIVDSQTNLQLIVYTKLLLNYKVLYPHFKNHYQTTIVIIAIINHER